MTKTLPGIEPVVCDGSAALAYAVATIEATLVNTCGSDPGLSVTRGEPFVAGDAEVVTQDAALVVGGFGLMQAVFAWCHSRPKR